MTDQESLLAAIRANPADDLPRLVFADFVEERGQERWANLIRNQCELAVLVEPTWCKDQHDTSESPRHWCQYCSWQEKANPLERAVVRLWGSWPEKDDVRTLFHDAMPATQFEWGWYVSPDEPDPPYHHQSACQVGRGFIATVAVTMADWMANGPALVRLPVSVVEKVVIVDREPEEFGGGSWEWWRNGFLPDTDNPEQIPDRVYTFIAGKGNGPAVGAGRHENWSNFATKADANAALSVACLAWAWSVEPQGVRA